MGISKKSASKIMPLLALSMMGESMYKGSSRKHMMPSNGESEDKVKEERKRTGKHFVRRNIKNG